MKSIVLIFTVTLVIVCISSIKSDPAKWTDDIDDPCPTDRVYNPCGSACPLTCAQPKKGKCNRMCVPGCFCKPGLYENAAGNCVTLDECYN
uniref:TIL domain-containing protein n=1 Tax=Tetranychus urticae TaxID=32264 RepID=T1KUK2_TETUR